MNFFNRLCESASAGASSDPHQHSQHRVSTQVSSLLGLTRSTLAQLEEQCACTGDATERITFADIDVNWI
jgi:hypothetical protein